MPLCDWLSQRRQIRKPIGQEEKRKVGDGNQSGQKKTDRKQNRRDEDACDTDKADGRLLTLTATMAVVMKWMHQRALPMTIEMVKGVLQLTYKWLMANWQ